MDLRKNVLWFFCGFAAALTLLLVILLVIQPALTGPQAAHANALFGDAVAADEPVTPKVQSANALEDALKSDLQILRGQLELFRVQHLDRWPGQDAQGRFYGELFVSQLTRLTNKYGQLETVGSEHSMGPYLQAMPANPFVKGPSAAKVTGGPGPVPCDSKSGWYFNTQTKTIHPNDPEHANW